MAQSSVPHPNSLALVVLVMSGSWSAKQLYWPSRVPRKECFLVHNFNTL